MKYSGIGGQAVIEGIMMQNGENYAVAVRKPDGEIEVKKDTYRSVTKKYPFLGRPSLSRPVPVHGLNSNTGWKQSAYLR